jgi:hypothetical protein
MDPLAREAFLKWAKADIAVYAAITGTPMSIEAAAKLTLCGFGQWTRMLDLPPDDIAEHHCDERMFSVRRTSSTSPSCANLLNAEYIFLMYMLLYNIASDENLPWRDM